MQRPPDPKPRPAPDALRAYLETGGTDGRKISVRRAAAVIGVSAPTLLAYMAGEFLPSPARRDLIEAFTGGRALASAWPDESERAIRLRISVLFPNYQPAQRAA